MSYSKWYKSPEQRKKRREKAKRAINARWEKHRCGMADEPVRKDLPQDMYRLTWENLMTGKTEVLLFHPGTRLNNNAIDVNGVPWKTCGLSGAFDLIRKSCYRIARDR